VGCKVISSAGSSTPWRAWNPQNDVTADSFRFTLAAEQYGATDGSTATRPSRACGGTRSHATNPATSSSRAVRQSTPCRPR
jgi:hypothetical protein